MPATSRPFSQAQIVRAVRGAEAAGLTVRGVEIGTDGAIRVLTVDPAELDRRNEQGIMGGPPRWAAE